MDGDIVFALATGRSGHQLDAFGFVELCAAAAVVMARAIARGVYLAHPEQGDLMPCFR